MKSPRSVITGGISEPAGAQIAFGVDWLGFTFFPGDAPWQLQLTCKLSQFFRCQGWTRKGGWNGYEQSARFGECIVAWGGAHQAGSVHVEVPGVPCGSCSDWAGVVAWLEGMGARLTRVDLCADDYRGDRLSVDWALAEYAGSGFAGRGTKPVGRLIDDLGSGGGRTVYVGKRENGKLVRVYEKGKQLGDKLSQWCRFECEWRAKDRVLPFDMLLRPVEFLAGSFPCVSWFAEVAARVRTFKEKAVISYGRMVAIARQHAGRAITAMLTVSGGDLGHVVSLLRRSGLPSRVNAMEIAALAGAS